MTESQKKVAADISVAVMSCLAAGAVVVAISAYTNHLVGGTIIGDAFVALCASFADLKLMLGGLAVVVMAGAGYFGAACISNRKWFAVVSILASGILACIAIRLAFSSDDLVKNIFQPSTVGNYEYVPTFLNDATPLVIWTGGALVSGLAAFLGFSLSRKG